MQIRDIETSKPDEAEVIGHWGSASLTKGHLTVKQEVGSEGTQTSSLCNVSATFEELWVAVELEHRTHGEYGKQVDWPSPTVYGVPWSWNSLREIMLRKTKERF